MTSRIDRAPARVSSVGAVLVAIAAVVCRVFLGGVLVGSAFAAEANDAVIEDRNGDGTEGLTGAQAFMACAGCHSLDATAGHGIGPNLHGLAGRRAGGAEDFAYSPALAASEITWEAGKLTAWILQAERMVPGTWMLYHNHLEPAEVSRLVDYLLSPP